MPNQGPRLILASASPRRKYLMRKSGFRFVVHPSRISEHHKGQTSPRHLVKRLAQEKALSVSKKYPTHVVLGADTVVFIGKKIIGKPKNQNHAKKILKMLSGHWQDVYTGVSVVWNGGKNKKTSYAVSRVKFRELSDKDIDRAARRHLDKAGAYSVQEKKDPFVEEIRGDFDNVVGLPMKVVQKLLRGAG